MNQADINDQVDALLKLTMKQLEKIEISNVFAFQARLNKLIDESTAQKVGIKNYVGEKNEKNARNKLLVLDVINGMKMSDVAAKYCIGSHSVRGYYEKFWKAFFKSKGWNDYPYTSNVADSQLIKRYVYRNYDEKELIELIEFANEYF